MKYVVNVQSKQPDIDPRSLRARVKDRDKAVLRDTYFLIDPEESPSKRLKMGYTVIYPTGRTTGHSHDEEEVYFVISGEGVMVVGDDEFPIKPVMRYTCLRGNFIPPIRRETCPWLFCG